MDESAKAGLRKRGLEAVFPGMPDVRAVTAAISAARWPPALLIFAGRRPSACSSGPSMRSAACHRAVPDALACALADLSLCHRLSADRPFIAVGLTRSAAGWSGARRFPGPACSASSGRSAGGNSAGWPSSCSHLLGLDYQIRLLIALVLGRLSFSTLPKFFHIVLTTPEGWLFLVLGHIVGAVLALILFSLTVVSVPLLMERDLDIVTAMATSVRAVLASPVPMLGWGVVVTLLVLAGAASAFIGLVVVQPVLGHAPGIFYRAIIPPA